MEIDEHTPNEGRCPECGIYGELRYDAQSGETDCVNCGASWGPNEKVPNQEEDHEA
jgi:transcription initiation factor TFIIIB Brf1 subunit/transcription initiation factor TFIIB